MKEFKQIVVATHNPAKIQRLKDALLKVTDNVLTLADVGVVEMVEESGTTAEENAQIKAIFYAKLTKELVFAQDTALYVDFLPEDKQPGVYVRRVGGKELTDDELFAYWEAIIVNVPKEKRTGRWHAAFCLATPDGKVYSFSIDHPRIFFHPPSSKRVQGWPMDSLMGHSRFNKPQSELTDEERKEVYREMDDILMEKLPEFFRRIQRKRIQGFSFK